MLIRLGYHGAHPFPLPSARAATLIAVTPTVRGWLDQLSTPQWALLSACTGFLGGAGLTAICCWVFEQHIDMRELVQYGATGAIFCGSTTALARYLSTL
jgi:hypothetical protein